MAAVGKIAWTVRPGRSGQPAKPPRDGDRGRRDSAYWRAYRGRRKEATWAQ